MNNFVERFLKYVKIDTVSDPSSNVCPSSDIQLNLAKVNSRGFERIRS
ncbi:MAG: hypothetical protein OGM09_13055 [Fusobacterium varium]|nr:hypothetical protein [Fusobacterium varium]UYI78073.1 MAG: hypothetical protein OGM09_13055 [Fusobacterium varium]